MFCGRPRAASARSAVTPSTIRSVLLLVRTARATACTSGGQNGPVLFLVVEDTSGTANHAGQRVLVNVNGQACFLRKQNIETTDERSTAGHDNPALDDVGSKLGRRDLQRAAHGSDDLLNRLLNRIANFGGMNPYALGNARDEIASLHFHFALFTNRIRRSDLNLHLLGGRFTDEEIVVLSHRLKDRHVELVTAGANRRIADDAGQRDHRDLRRSATDVDYHVPGRRFHW